MLRPADISAGKDPQSAPSHADDRRAAPADLQLLLTTASLGAPDGATLKNKHTKNNCQNLTVSAAISRVARRFACGRLPRPHPPP